MIHAVLVGVGGFIGALLRYEISGFVHRQLPMTVFPLGTAVVNLLGCLLIGMAAGLVESRQLFAPEFRIFALIGILGGFTTFSTFGYETFALVRDNQWLGAVTNVGIQVVAGLLLVWVGYMLTVSR